MEIWIAIGVAIIFILFVTKDRIKYTWSHYIFRPHQYDYLPPQTITVEEKLKLHRFETEEILSYGQNYFAVDRRHQRIFLQSSCEPDGLFLDIADIVSYTLEENSVIVNSFPFENAKPSSAKNNSGEKIKSLIIKIKTKDTLRHEILLPFIQLSTEKGSFTYNTASQVAGAISLTLSGVLEHE